MNANPGKLLHAGMEHHQAGRLAQAEDHYRQILAQEPVHPDALHLLGLAHHQRGQNAAALPLLRQALGLMPDCWLFHSSLGCTLHALGQTSEALAHHMRALELMPGNPSLHNNLGSALEDLRNYADAETHYRAALAVNDHYADAHYNLANVLRETRRAPEAILEYERAIQLNPQYVQAHVNLANVLLAEGRTAEAGRRYRWALELDPDNADTLCNLALSLLRCDRFDEAREILDRVIAIRPEHHSAAALREHAVTRTRPPMPNDSAAMASAVLNATDRTPRGRISDSRWGLYDVTLAEAYRHALELHKRDEQLEIVEGIYREIIRLDRQHADATYKLGVLLRQTGRHEQALVMLERAIELDPRRPGAYFHKSTALLDLERKEEAVAPLCKTIELRPDFGEAHLNLGAVYERLGRLDEALPACRQAVALLPRDAQAHYNLANVLLHSGTVPECLREYDQVVALDPNFAKGQWNRGLTQLLLGDFAHGWDGYEWRERAGEVKIDQYELPRWDGSHLAGRTILVHAEQGVGDEILFNSCIPDLLEQKARVALTCDPRLKDLFARSFPGVTMLPLQRTRGETVRPESGVDCHVPNGTLPYFLRRSWDAFPRRHSYLVADATQTAEWRQRFASLGEGLKVGISWRAGGKASEQRRRTTELAAWEPLLTLPGVHFINLQYGKCDEDLAQVREQFGVTIHDWPDADPLANLDGFAAQVAAMDLVISVGNTTIHTAGALGIPAWAALPMVPGWRWLLNGESIPWYTTVRLFRQTDATDWLSVFERLAAVVQDLLRERGSLVRRPTAATRIDSEARVALPPPIESTVALEALLDEGLDAHHQGDHFRAEHVYRRVLEADPQHTDALNLLGSLARQNGQPETAIELISRAVALRPELAAYRYNLGNALRDIDRMAEAADHYREAVRIEPGFATAHLNLAVTLKDLGLLEAAREASQRAVELDLDCPEAWYNAGAILVELRLYHQALDMFRAALRLRPDYFDALTQLAGTLRTLGKLDEARAGYEQALRLHPQHGEAHTQRGMILLQQGHLAEGWAEYQWRWHSAHPPVARQFEQPVWGGRAISAETLLIFGEQGLGDEIMFASCFEEAIGMAGRTIIECAPRLVGLFARSFPSAQILSRGDVQSPHWQRVVTAADTVIPAGSLPFHLRRDISDFAQAAYLTPDPLAVENWYTRLAPLPSGLRVGLAWRGGRDYRDGRERSIPIELLAELVRTPGVQFIPLQPVDDAWEVFEMLGRTSKAVFHLWPDWDASNDFDALAALISSLDLVINVGTATAHLAGALGAETWTLVPFAPSWRWFSDQETSPWYPRMRVLRQPSLGDWKSLLQRVSRELRQRAVAPPTPVPVAAPIPVAARSGRAPIPGPHFVNPKYRARQESTSAHGQR